jgi:hypothetical protein
MKGTAMLIDHDGKCKFNFGVCLIKAKLASMPVNSISTTTQPTALTGNEAMTTGTEQKDEKATTATISTSHNREPEKEEPELDLDSLATVQPNHYYKPRATPAPHVSPAPFSSSPTTTTTTTVPNAVPFHPSVPTGHHGEKEVVFCFGKIFSELLIMRRLSAIENPEEERNNTNHHNNSNAEKNEDGEKANSAREFHAPDSEQWLRRRITLAMASVHPILADVIVRCTCEERASRPSFSELIGLLQLARVDISIPPSVSPLANQLWKQDEFLTTRKVCD